MKSPTTFTAATVVLLLLLGCSGKDSIKQVRARAMDGDAAAQFALGEKYARGEEVPTDRSTAVGWYRKAAQQGHAEAQLALGQAMTKGDGAPKDPAGALQWFRQAADRGIRSAQLELGLSYLNGVGTPADPVQAFAWLTVAGAQGHELSGQRLTDIEAKLSVGQKAEAERMITEFTRGAAKR